VPSGIRANTDIPLQSSAPSPTTDDPASRAPGEYCRMLIALLAVLGVDLIVIVVIVAVVLSRRLWVSRQPGVFKGAIRVVQGEVPGLKAKWKRGHGRWIRDVLVWNKAPFGFRNEFVAAEALAGEIRVAGPGEIKRLGKHPAVIPVTADGGARIEIAVTEDGREQAHGPFPTVPGAAAGSPAAL
jgi:hypothetical protein